ncbi:FHA domain-containing protein [Hydrogenispora ethanolica]|jgi:hypothetical protein|uniref:FHA domain-containing protein n=1 Tax=Hydrogenispora ethanolica TaxID=1082276 RepID=A0A4R1R968_HYDET|nr:FHA domain-containing protein [Hydrogenispora ethanolica]TCL62100.1 FHA domain-containing protein [Hydrogenispora ethanolica]
MNIRRLFHRILRPQDAGDAIPGGALKPAPRVAHFFKGMALPWVNAPEKTNRWPALQNTKNWRPEGPGVTEKTKVRPKLQALAEEQWVFTVSSGLDRGRQFVGATPEIKLGRQPDNHIQLRDPKVSRFHAVIHQKGSQLYLEDLRSTNGTFLNGEPLAKKKPLSPGDQIKIGETVIEVSRDYRTGRRSAGKRLE